jgi:hypothetical protein
MTLDIWKEPYLLQAYDAEFDEELNPECYQTEAGFLRYIHEQYRIAISERQTSLVKRFRFNYAMVKKNGERDD